MVDKATLAALSLRGPPRWSRSDQTTVAQGAEYLFDAERLPSGFGLELLVLEPG